MHLHALTLYTRDLAAQRDFYAHTLGFPVEAQTSGQVTFRTGSSLLSLVEDATASGFSHLAWDIPPGQVDEAQAWLSPRVRLLHDKTGEKRFLPGERWNTTNLYFEDPDGNILEFAARHHLLPLPAVPGPFGPQEVRHLSEFGLVVPDVNAAVRDLASRFGLFPFNGQSETFTAVGSHEGMFIVVPEGRGWFPVGRPAVPAPFRVTFSGGPHHHRLARASKEVRA
ncbi:VOC family protein [Deinococcus hopiensis]|uniref:Catechol-2,3-dioxygenase n=1 Tax=Deinococcus hopiensis KR-140 TaxID=695939 RepID=A0A1W1VAN3_9DEIO|nr:VOC family protein [Deinococcus hopiensis]SMB90418.1 Catechol-2,3-dioxygenase [Deinococcus hopiensis KR-140]